jgi:hypothetical protein
MSFLVHQTLARKREDNLLSYLEKHYHHHLENQFDSGTTFREFHDKSLMMIKREPQRMLSLEAPERYSMLAKR